VIDYTEIPNKIEDISSAINSLYNLVSYWYNDIFLGEDEAEYQRLLRDINRAHTIVNEVGELNNRLSRVLEESLASGRLS